MIVESLLLYNIICKKLHKNVENEINYGMSKKYNVYGIGNALVDIVTEVDDQFLQDNRLKRD